MRTISILSVLALAGAFAGAAEAAGGSSSKSGPSNRYQASWTLATPSEPESHAETDAKAADSSRQIEMPVIVAPIVVDGRLRNYAFVGVRLDVSEGRDPWAVRARTAYLRDAMLRAAHAQPLNDPGDAGGINPERASRVWTTAANAVLGEGAVKSVSVLDVDLRYPDLAGGR